VPIEKKLKLIAELDDRKIKRQIASLKKELKGLTIKGQDLSGFSKSTATLKEAAKELRKAIRELKGVSPRNITMAAGMGRSSGIPGVTGRNGASAGFITDLKTGREFKTREAFEKRMSIERHQDQKKALRAAQISNNRIEAAKTKAIHAESQNRRKSLKKELSIRERGTKNIMVATLRQAGVGLPQGRVITEAASSKLEGGFTGLGRGIRRSAYRGLRGMGLGAGATRGVLGAVGNIAGALGVAGAAVGAVGLVANRIAADAAAQRESRQLQAKQRQENTQDLIAGKGLETRIRQQARLNTKGDISAGIGKTVSDLFSLKLGSVFSGASYRAGKLGAQQEEINTQLIETADTRAARDRARALRGSRVTALRGSNLGPTGGEFLTALQNSGATRGFSAEQTLQQFTQARKAVGTNMARTGLGLMQNLTNRTGIGIGEQAKAMEAFTGASRGPGRAVSPKKLEEILKKGVAGGVQASKLDQYLKTTADYVTQTQGFGQVDVSRMTSNIARFSSGFAGGGPVTQQNLNQAQRMQTMLTGESTGMGGLAGIGNLQATQGLMKRTGVTDPAAFLALMRSDVNASPEEIRKTLKRSGATGNDTELLEQSKRFLRDKNATLKSGATMAAGGNELMGQVLSSMERNISFNQQGGMNAAYNGKLSSNPNLPKGPSGIDFKSISNEFKGQQIEFTAGLKVMAEDSVNASENLKALTKQLEVSVKTLEKYNTKIKLRTK